MQCPAGINNTRIRVGNPILCKLCCIVKSINSQQSFQISTAHN